MIKTTHTPIHMLLIHPWTGQRWLQTSTSALTLYLTGVFKSGTRWLEPDAAEFNFLYRQQKLCHVQEKKKKTQQGISLSRQHNRQPQADKNQGTGEIWGHGWKAVGFTRAETRRDGHRPGLAWLVQLVVQVGATGDTDEGGKEVQQGVKCRRYRPLVINKAFSGRSGHMISLVRWMIRLLFALMDGDAIATIDGLVTVV